MPAWPWRDGEGGRGTTSQLPAFSPTADRGRELLRPSSAHDLMIGMTAQAHWGAKWDEEGQVLGRDTSCPYAIAGVFSWALCYGWRCCEVTARTAVIGVFQQCYRKPEIQKTAVVLHHFYSWSVCLLKPFIKQRLQDFSFFRLFLF